jgi:hypothetical protein
LGLVVGFGLVWSETIMDIQHSAEDDAALEEEIAREIVRDFGASESQILEFFGGPGFIERILTSN